MNKFLDGMKIGFGIIFSFILFFGVVYAAGFHNANEIIAGTFSGNYIFNSSPSNIVTTFTSNQTSSYLKISPTGALGSPFRIGVNTNFFSIEDQYGNNHFTILNTSGNIGIGTTNPSVQFEITCPAGFTNIKAGNNQLGCMQTTEEGTGSWTAGSQDCFTTYGGRIPTVEEWVLSMGNYALTNEIDGYEWTSNIGAVADNDQVIVGNGAITSRSSATYSNSYDYRCFIPR